jgi:uncharacterized protein
MHYLFHLGHPAHFHLFRHTIETLISKGNRVSVMIKKKDILEELLKESGIPYINILEKGRKDSRPGIALGLVKQNFRLLTYCLRHRPDLMIGTSTEIGHVGFLLGIHSINVNEDDADVVPLYCKLSYPFSDCILSPSSCNNGKWERKSIKYSGYHELAYLHPNKFQPSSEIVRKYIKTNNPYFLIRFIKLTAHHDKDIRGISDEFALKIINVLKPFGDVFITSERKLDDKFEEYRLEINPLDIHHIMAFSSLYIGDSQTMAAEAGVLGVPFVRFNDFVGKIGYLNELENYYKLGFGISPSEPDRLLDTVVNLVSCKDNKDSFVSRRQIMLKEKIDLSNFMLWLFENYPESAEIMRKDPVYQTRFK